MLTKLLSRAEMVASPEALAALTIVSIKLYELAKHLQKFQGHIVYSGDCTKHECDAAAVSQELGVNSTSVQELNNCLAHGALRTGACHHGCRCD